MRWPACTGTAPTPVGGRTRCGLAAGHRPPCVVRVDHANAPLVPDVVGTRAELATLGEVIMLNRWHCFIRTPDQRLLVATLDSKPGLVW